jgi:hypothetical protein
MNRETTCLLCGITSHDVTTGLVAWKNPIGRDRFAAIPKCRDKVACRDRVEAAGEPWELEERPVSAKELIR